MRSRGFADYEALRSWSVAEPAAFWTAIWDRFAVQADGDPTTVLASASMPGARWFPDVRLSYAEHVFRDRDPDALAVQHASELRGLEAWTWERLREETARVRAGLLALGVGRGDRVAAYMPNLPQALAAFLATASLGAIWSSCSPDFGVRTVLDRFGQIEPTVLLAVDGYRYRGRDFDRRDVVAELRAGLPSVRHTVTFAHLGGDGDWDQVFPATSAPLEFERVPFDHPLWILYSSGTTGRPKAIVHGHGGILLEQLKTMAFHIDAREGDRIFWFTTTGWMMWNLLVSVLLSPASIVLYDGDPGHPDLGRLWDLAADAGVTTFGTSAAYLHGCVKSDLAPHEGRDLSALRAVGSTGSPLSPEGFGWVYDQLGPVWLFSTSGGTDVCTSFVGGCPVLPVRAGELQARVLGAAVESWSEDGRPLTDEVGELVVTAPMPSMPVGLWNDPGHERYREAYFSMFPGTWRQGDWIRITPQGSAVIYGRSDSTINRGGVRMGTAELYAAVLADDDVTDALVVDVPGADPSADASMLLFVVLGDGARLDEELESRLRPRIRQDASPRHVPDEVIAVEAVPRTLTGKLLEVPVKKLLLGRKPEEVATRDALADPAAFDWFVRFAHDRLAGSSPPGAR